MHKSKYFIKILLSLIALIVIVIPISTFAIYSNYSKTLIESTYAKYNDFLAEITARTMVYDEWIEQLSAFLYYSPYIYNMMISNNLEPINEVRGRLSMRQTLSSTPNLDSIYLYNGELNIFYSSTSVNKSWDNFFDKDMTEKLDRLKPSEYTKIIPRKIDFTINNTQTTQDVLTLLIPRNYNLDVRDNSVLIVNFNADTLNNMISPELTDQEEFYYMNQDNLVLYAGDTKSFMQDMSSTYWMTQINENNLTSGHFLFEEDTVSYLVCYSYVEKTDGYMVYIAQKDMLFKKSEDLRLWTLILTALLMSIMVVVAIIVSRYLYKPLDNLVHMVDDDNEDSGNETFINDEFKLIENRIKKMRDNNSNMVMHQLLQQDAIAHYFMKELLTIRPDYSDNIEELFIENKIIVNPNNLIPVYMQLDTTTKSIEELNMLRTALVNMAQDIATEPILLLHMENDTIALLYNYNIGQGEWLYEFTNTLKESFISLFKCSFTTSVGNASRKPHELYLSWHEAILLSDYRFILGFGSFITYDKIKNFANGDIEYPAKKERYIIDALNLGQKENIDKSINIMFKYFTTQSVDDAKLSLRRLLSTLVREFSRILSSRHYKQENTSNLFDQLHEFSTIDEVKLWMIKMCYDIIDEISPSTNDIKQDHVNNAIRIIKENYGNSNLSPNSIASTLGLSSSYLREIFSQYTDTFLPKYINRYRCEMAKDLLKKTKLPISIISERIGIANTKYFYSLFKKNTGMTPSDFRDLNKTK